MKKIELRSHNVVRRWTCSRGECSAPAASLALTLGIVTLVTSCATGQSPALVPGVAPAPNVVPAPSSDTPARKLPHFKISNSIAFYPARAKRLSLTGRVLVEFQIDKSGTPTGLRVIQAEADPSLQSAALDLVRHAQFDLSDPTYDAADPASYRVSVSFCLVTCGALTPFPGYEKESVVVTGTIIRSR